MTEISACQLKDGVYCGECGMCYLGPQHEGCSGTVGSPYHGQPANVQVVALTLTLTLTTFKRLTLTLCSRLTLTLARVSRAERTNRKRRSRQRGEAS